MDFTWTETAIAGVGWLLLICLVIAGVGKVLFDSRFWTPFSSAFLIGLVIGNLCSLTAAQASESLFISSTEAAAEFGLASDQPYPLVLGGDSVGGAIEANASSSFFTTQVSASASMGSTLKVEFQNGGTTDILEIPLSKTRFVTTNDPAAETIVLRLANNKTYGLKTMATSGPCRWSLNLIFFQCDLQDTYSVELDDGIVSRGLSPIVSSNLDSVLMTVTPATYDAILGKTG